LPAAMAETKYWWGDEVFSLNWMMLFLVVSGLAIGGLLGKAGPGAAVADSFPAATELRGVALVTCTFMFMWYIFLGHQVGIKFTEGLTADVQEQAKYIADRSVINTMEQALPFLSLMWLEALFVNPETARLLGWIYVATRFLYPITYGMYGQFNTAVEISTSPNYVIIFYFLWSVVYKCASGTDFHTKVHEISPWLMLLVGFACSFGSVIMFLVVAKPTTGIIVNGVKKDKGVLPKLDEFDGDEELEEEE